VTGVNVATTRVSHFSVLLAKSSQDCIIKTTRNLGENTAREPVRFSTWPQYCRYDLCLETTSRKAIEQRMALYIVFIDFTKAFDSLGRDALWRIMMKYGCSPRLLAVIKAFHTDM